MESKFKLNSQAHKALASGTASRTPTFFAVLTAPSRVPPELLNNNTLLPNDSTDHTSRFISNFATNQAYFFTIFSSAFTKILPYNVLAATSGGSDETAKFPTLPDDCPSHCRLLFCFARCFPEVSSKVSCEYALLESGKSVDESVEASVRLLQEEHPSHVKASG